jgi:hypothetical protein
MKNRPSLSVENLESRLNLSTLAGVAVPDAITMPVRAEERITLQVSQVVSLTDVVGSGPLEGSAGDAEVR